MQENKLLTQSTDPHLFFTFNNVYSKNWNLFIENTNKGGGTKIVASPDKTVSFATPDYQNNTYYLGTTKKQKTFKHTLAANMLDKNDVQAILQWLKIGQTGFLYYDTNKYWGWDVVVSDVGEVSQYEDSTGIIIEFSVEFKTINDWHARSVYDAWKGLDKNDENGKFETINSSGEVVSQSIANEYGIPEICQKGTTVFLPQVCDEHSFIKLDWTVPKNQSNIKVEIKNANSTILSYSLRNLTDEPVNCSYDSRYGFTISGKELLENTSFLMDNTDTISSVFNMDNVLPTTDSTKYANFTNKYECRIYAVEQDTLYDVKSNEDGTFPLKYSVEIKFCTDRTGPNDKNEYTDVWVTFSNVSSTPGEPIATYYGLYNTLTVDPTQATGTLTILKHSSL